MAKKKLTKKNKTLLLTIGAAAVGVGFILAKAFKKKESNLAGIGALKYTNLGEPIRDYKGYMIVRKDRLGKNYYVVYQEGHMLSKHWTLKAAKAKIDWYINPDPKSPLSQIDHSVDNWLESIRHYY